MYRPTQYDENRKKAWMITLIIHVFLLIFFLFYGLTQPDPLPEEQGVEVALGSLGTTQTGFGKTEVPNEQVESAKPKVEEVQPEPEPVEETVQPSQDLTQDDSEIAVPEREKPKEEPKEEKPKEEPKEEKPKE